MIRKIELLARIADIDNRVMWLEDRVEKLEKKKTRKGKKDEGQE